MSNFELEDAGMKDLSRETVTHIVDETRSPKLENSKTPLL